jgi:predicted ribosome quality control (RQC) complex YloA/Tae2 family protein
MRDMPLKLITVRDEISWEDPGPKEARREVWQREIHQNHIAVFYNTEARRNYQNTGHADRIVSDVGGNKIRLSERDSSTHWLWKDCDLFDMWEYLVEDEETDTQEAIEAEIRRQLEKAKEDFDTLIEAADKALADFDKAQEQDAKETAAIHLCQAFEDVMGLFDDSDTAQYFSVKGDQAEYQRALKRAKDAIRTFQAS